ncbi:hypothetical protein B0H13DRAFT_2664086 [Mycena leptocephala]|nr:hypothetical protein B0H13DRAFT_2664086 [Mycena leptocephala]
MASAISSERDSHDPLQRQCSPLLIARSIWRLPYPASGTLTTRCKGSAPRSSLPAPYVCVALRSHLHTSLASYRPSPSITVSSDHRLVYVYAYAYANVNVLALSLPSRVHPPVPDWVWDFLDHLAHPRLLLPLTEWCCSYLFSSALRHGVGVSATSFLPRAVS